MSASATKCSPPPAHTPFTAAITGFHTSLCHAVKRSANRFVRRDCSRSASRSRASCATSRPVWKASPFPVLTMTCTSGSSSSARHARSSSLHHPRVHRVARPRAGRRRASRPARGARPAASRIAGFGLGHAHRPFVVASCRHDRRPTARDDTGARRPGRRFVRGARGARRRSGAPHVRRAGRGRPSEPGARWSRAGSSPAIGSRSGRRTARQWVIAALGIFDAGGVLVPLNTRFKGGRGALRARPGRREDALHRHRLPRHQLRGDAASRTRARPSCARSSTCARPSGTSSSRATTGDALPDASPATTSARSSSRRARRAGPRARC